MNEKNKNNIGLIVIIIILLVSVLGMGLFIAYDKGTIFKKSDNIENKQGDDVSNEQSNDVATNNSTQSSTSSSTTAAILKLDESKCINDKDYNYVFNKFVSDLVSISTSTEDSNYTINVNWDNLKKVSMDITKTGIEMKTITNIDTKKVVDINIDGIGQDITGATILFLMEDGSVEYIPLRRAAIEDNFNSYGKLNDVTDVIKFYTASASPKNSQVGGFQTILAQKADGTYYDLNKILKGTGNY